MMEPIMMKDEHHLNQQHNHHPQASEYHHNPWGHVTADYSPHTQSPVNEYSSYAFPVLPPHTIGMPMEPSLQHSMAPMYSSAHVPQPLYPTQWPSMLTNPSQHSSNHMPAPHVHAPSNFQGPPILPRLTTTHHTGSSRRTLTDQDRRRMCQYHEDHPNVKQTEIGAMFGVERSTVSKVLRQREKYLHQEDGSRSPIKKNKGKFPDIERALSNWVRNHQKSGLPLSDSIIKEKARFFASTVGSTDCAAKVNSASWLEKFKQKNHLMGAKPRKGSDSSELGLETTSSGHVTPNGLSPVSPSGYVPSALSNAQSMENLKSESPDSYADASGLYKHGQATSATSLASCFSDATAPSSFSPHSPSSPFFVGEMNKMHNPSSLQMSSGATYQSTTSETYGGSAMLSNSTNLQAAVDGFHPRNLSLSCDVPQSHAGSKAHSPVHGSPRSVFPSGNNFHGPPPTQDDARRALELVMTFFQQQPSGIVEAQEYITMGKLMEKLKVQGCVGELPGGMHSINLVQSQKEMSRKRSVQGLM